jgi:transposase
LENKTESMAFEATVKVCDPIRVPVNDPLFQERDPAIRAKMNPVISFPSNRASSASAPAPSCSSTSPVSAPASSDSPAPGDLLKARCDAGYWKSRHQRCVVLVKKLRVQLAQADALRKDKAASRIAELEEQLATAKARIRQLEQRCFGRKTESSASSAPDKLTTPADTPAGPPRPRGQQRGKPGPKRRDHQALPAVEEVLDLPADRRCCSACGLAFRDFPGALDSEVLEIDVRAYRRVIKRKRYRPACSCGKHKGILAAPSAPRVIPKSNLGVSIWVEVLLGKYRSHVPVHRLLADWRSRGLDLPSGTVIGGLKKLPPLFEPVYQALIEHIRKQKHWHGDETRWLVFAKTQGKVGHRWMLWVLHSAEAAVYLLDPTRGHEVPEKALGPLARGIMSVDRYSAYKAMKQVKEGKIVLAFCWAHVRRDFLEVARSWPEEHEEWGLGWVKRIGLLYSYNKERVEALEKPALFLVKDEQVRKQVVEMARQRDEELSQPRIAEERRKVLSSLKEHWSGLVVFVDNPSVPLDNNQAERDLRGPVVGRKNYYGSGAKWAGELAAVMFSVFETLEVWNLNPRAWLTEYLQECARAGGKPPEDLKGFLPWEMSEERKKDWALQKQQSEGGP